MFIKIKSEKSWLINLILDLLRRDIIQERMFMQQWGRLIVDVTLLSFLCIKKIDVPLFYRHEI